MKPTPTRATHRTRSCAVAWVLAIATWPLMAQPANQPKKAPAFKPSAAQIERAITSMLLCDWMDTDAANSTVRQENQAVMDYIELNRPGF
jgi:hypothetical protein